MHKPYEFGRVESSPAECASYHYADGVTIYVERRAAGWEARLTVPRLPFRYAWGFTALEAVKAFGVTGRRLMGRRTALPSRAVLSRARPQRRRVAR